MTSKELLEQANDKARKITKLSNKIKVTEEILNEASEDGRNLEIQGVHIHFLFNEALADVVSSFILDELHQVNKQHIYELEKLLGVEPKEIIDPVDKGHEEKAYTEAEEKQQDPIEKGLSEILKKESDRIGGTPEPQGSPEQKGTREMTVEDVTRMYVAEDMTKKQIAAYYKISESKVNNFIFLKDIRKRKAKTDPKSEGQNPDQKECP